MGLLCLTYRRLRSRPFSSCVKHALDNDGLTETRCKLVYTPFGDVDQFSVRAIACYERALEEAEHAGTKVRALVLTNPHNPLGMCPV